MSLNNSSSFRDLLEAKAKHRKAKDAERQCLRRRKLRAHRPATLNGTLAKVNFSGSGSFVDNNAFVQDDEQSIAGQESSNNVSGQDPSDDDNHMANDHSPFAPDHSFLPYTSYEVEHNVPLIGDIVQKLQLDKSDTNTFLQFLRNFTNNYDLPATNYQLWKSLDVKFDYITKFYCSNDKCLNQLVHCKDKCSSTSCKTTNINSELIVFPIKTQLRRIIKMNYDLIQWYSRPNNQYVGDIVTGDIYIEKNTTNNITLLLATDGKPLIKSNRTSVWPILCTIVEIPPPVREWQKNIGLLALWHGPIQPPINLFFQDTVNQLKQLETIGLTVNLGAFGNLTFHVRVQLITGDMPARSKFNQMKNHNGYYACSKCELPGRRCECSNHIVYSWHDYVQMKPYARTQTRIDQQSVALSLDGINKSYFGVMGASPLASIISIPKQSNMDYFHLALEVHLDRVLKHWKCHLTNQQISLIDSYLCSITYPHTFHRIPLQFSKLHEWKASQLRTFLIYDTMPILFYFTEIFPPDRTVHFSLYFIYLRTLRFVNSRNDIESMKHFIIGYLKDIDYFYDDCVQLYSTHALYHLYEQVLDHGSLCFHSMFGIESALHHLEKMANGTTALGSQIAYWHCIYSALWSHSTVYTRQLFENQGPLNGYSYIDDKFIQMFKTDFDTVFLTYFGCHVDASVHFFSRYQCGLYVFHSHAYTRRGRSTSYNVTIYEPSSTNVCAGEILFFFRYKNENFFLFRQFKNSDLRCSSLFKMDPAIPSWRERIDNFYSFVYCDVSSLVLHSCSRIKNKCIFFPFNDELKICTEIEHELEHD